MVHTKQDLLYILQTEIQDRTETEAPKEEVEGLTDILFKVQTELDLSFSDYMWLCDLVSAAKEE